MRRSSGLLARWGRLTELGFPARFPVVQFPNPQLIVALLAGAVADDLRGGPHRYCLAIAYLSLTVWAYEELATGANWFRRLLGAGFLIVTVIRLARALAG